MAIQTGSLPGEQQSVFAEAPQFPSNLGKIDVGAIYDAVSKNIANTDQLAKGTRAAVEAGATLPTLVQQQQAQRQLIPAQTQAAASDAAATVTQNPLRTGILASTLARQAGTQASDIAKANAQNNDQKLQSDLNTIYTKSGIQYGAAQADAVNTAKGNLLQKISSSPGGVFNEPILGPNGIPIGSMVGYIGANGPEFHAVPIPFGQMARVNTGIKYQPIGPKIDPATGQSIGTQYQTVFPNAAGGITRGEVVTVAPGQPPPGDLYQEGGASGGSTPGTPGSAASGGTVPVGGGTVPASGQPTPIPGASTTGTVVPGGRLGAEFAQKQAEERAKMRQTALNDISANRDDLSKNSFSIGKLASDLTAEQNSTLGSGPITGGVLAALRPTARAVNSDLSNFVGQVMSSARNIRTQREFNAFTNAIPTASDQATVQNSKLQYLSAANETLQQRNDYKEQALRANPNLDVDQADQQAVAKFPFPTPPGGWQQHPDGTAIDASATPASAPSSPQTATQSTAAPGAPVPVKTLADAQAAMKTGQSVILNGQVFSPPTAPTAPTATP